MKTVTKTRKIKLIPVGESSKDKTNIYNYIKDIAKDLAEEGNKLIRLHVLNHYNVKELMDSKNLSMKEAKKEIELNLNTSLTNIGYQFTDDISHISSTIRNAFNNHICRTINTYANDIKNNKISIPSIRNTNITIPTSKKLTFIYEENKRYYVDFPLSLSEKKLLGKIQLSLYLSKKDILSRIVIKNIFEGEYEMCDSSFKLQDDDLYLLLTYKFEPKEKNILDRKKIMGLDVGINRTISFYISDEKYQPRQLEIDNHIHHEVVKREKTRSKIKKSLSQCKGGHGSKRKTQAALNSNKYNSSNWTKSKNHDISSAIIKIATKLGVGTIKMEDLTGITKNSKSFFMKSWAYDQLQQFIDYKAKSANIDVLWVDPKNTSNTCPTCKNSDPENRDDIDRTKFKCINPECEDFGKEKDADIVASQNITYKEGNILKQKSKQGRIENSKKKKEIINNEINF
jgi:putative transposase